MAAKPTETAETFSADERAAMKERAAEQRKAAKRGGAKEEKAAAERAETLAKIDGFDEPDRTIARRLHELASAEGLAARLWYGMPAWTREGKIVLFFKDRAKFKSRYATLGFEENAALDDGAMWASSFALLEPGEDEWARIAELVRRAAA